MAISYIFSDSRFGTMTWAKTWLKLIKDIKKNVAESEQIPAATFQKMVERLRPEEGLLEQQLEPIVMK